MITTVVYVKVKSEYVTDFIKATEKNHLNSVNESGNCRFDILQSPEDSSQFILYEAYQSETHASAHKETAHYKEWRQTVEHMMAEPRKGVKYNVLFP